MFMRKVFKLSAPLKNLSFSSQNALAYHLSHVEKFEGTRDIQEHVEENKDKLLPQLKSSSLPKMLITLQNNNHELQGFHIVAAMSSLYHLMKKEAPNTGDPLEQVNMEWKEHPFYQEMIDIIQSHMNKLSGSDIVQILYYSKKLKGSLELEKILIDHLQKDLKSLSLKDFRITSSLFKKVGKSKDLANLQNAMFKSFVKRVSMDYQPNNIEFLADGLYFLSCNSSKASAKLVDIFIKDLCNYNDDMPLDKALIIHDSLCYLHYENFSKKALELLKKTEESIIKNIDELEPISINYILLAVSNKIKVASYHSRDEFYNAAFIEKLTQRLVTVDAGFESTLSALVCLNKMRHCNKEILNYICASYFEKVALKEEQIANHNGKLSVILNGLAHANYKSMFWNEIEKYILNEQSLLDYDHKTLCILCLNAICLDCYPIKMLKKVFDGTYDYSKDTFLHWTLCKIYQKIKTNQSYKGPLPTELQIRRMNEMFENAFRERKKFPLLPYLEEAMGNSRTYVKTNLCTKLFHLIDHVVAFDKNDLPIPLISETNISKESTQSYIEDMKFPDQSKVILIIITPPIWYSKNRDELLGPYKVFMDTLTNMNYNVVDINARTWYNIPEREKKSFLLSLIRSKLKSITID